MKPAGYAGKSVADKLGIKSGARLAVIGAPPHYRSVLGEFPAGSSLVDEFDSPDILHVFVTCRAELAALAPKLIERPKVGGAIWISWPKKSSSKFIDLTESGIRDILLPTGWVDVKVCAIDDDWSGLKFLRRRAVRDR